MPRQITSKQFELRAWQSEAFNLVEEYWNKGKRDFLIVATPGAGKTKAALRIAHEFFIKKRIERLVIVAPSTNLTRQWATESVAFTDIDIDPDFINAQGIETNDFHGISITYALLGQDKRKVHAQNSFNKRTMVIFDEVHHAGDSLTWGKAVLEAFKDAVFRLCISGTAFRSDDAKIPFITYDGNNTSVADYTYSYERSILENVCRPVYFTISDGKMKWKVHEKEYEHTFKDSLTPDQSSKRLKTALDPEGNWMRDVLISANNKLTEVRNEGHRRAGGLIFAATQAHAKQIAKIISSITGEIAPVVISEDSDGSEKIELFKESNLRWLVSVKMVSEGIDIPRLRVGVYFTIVKSELFFRQAVGRFVRVQKELTSQDAYIFIPQDRELVKLAETIQEEREHALDKSEKSAAVSSTTDLWGNNYEPALKGKFVPLGSEVGSVKTIAVAVEVITRYGIDHQRIEENNPVFMQIEQIKKRLNSYAKRYALTLTNGNRTIRPDFKALHKLWIETGGKSMDIETLDELRTRESFYLTKLRGIRA